MIQQYSEKAEEKQPTYKLPVTPGYWLKKQYLPCRAIAEDHSLDAYMDKLKQEGAWINPCLQPALFETRNGLKYPGIMTTKTLTGLEVLVRIPKHLLLNTRICLNEPLLHEIYKEPFYRSASNWEDRVLATYLLWTYSRKQGIWYDMLLHMSRDIDILCFWPEADLKEFNDKTILEESRKALAKFEAEWEEFHLVIAKHNKLVPKELVTRDNYKWLYIHLVSRCFGRYLECITMVPFCEFFNHHITDVLYDFGYHEDNPYKSEESKYPPIEEYRTEEQRAMASSSDGSYESVEYDEELEFDYSGINVHKINWCSKVSDRLKQKETRAVDIAWKDINDWVLANIDWRDWSVLFVAQVLEKVNIMRNEYTAGRLKADQCLKELSELKSECNSYRMQTVKFYAELRGECFKYSCLNYSQRKSSTDSYEELKEFPRFNEDKFDEFVLRMNKRDYFEEGNQVYFCYGRLSNRMMLERYGVALQGNKFDHVWVKVNLLRYLEGYPDVLEVMQLRSMSLKRKFKVKRREFCYELLQFIRSTKWSALRNRLDEFYYPFDLDREYATLEDTAALLKKQLSHYEEEKALDEKLTQPSLSYHGYFATVYKLEHVRILTLQIGLLTICQDILRKLKDHVPFEFATQPEPGKERQYYYLKGYIERLKSYRK